MLRGGWLFYAQIKVMNIKIDDEIRAAIPPLSDEEKTQLEANLAAEGCRDPLVVWPQTKYELDGHTYLHSEKAVLYEGDEYTDGPVYGWESKDESDSIAEDDWPCVLIDGHNRHEICTRLGIEFETVAMEFEYKESAMDWIDANQLGRRNLTPDDFRLLLGRRYNRLNKGHGGDRKSSGQKAHLKTADTLAKQHGVNESTVRRAGKLAEAVEDVKAEEPELVARGPDEIMRKAKEISREKKEAKQEQFEQKKKQIAEQVAAQPIRPTVEKCDAVEWLAKQEQCDLLITDPPYMTDVDDIAKFAKSWLLDALAKVKQAGRAYIFIGAYPEEIAAYLSVAMPTQLLVWTYRNTLGPSPKMGYKLNWQAILYFEMPESAPLDCPIMNEQFSVQDINAPDGRLGNRYHAWQKPNEICERFIRHSTKQGDLVYDPFACTGSTVIAASKLGRIGKGCDISTENLKIAEDRGCQLIG